MNWTGEPVSVNSNNKMNNSNSNSMSPGVMNRIAMFEQSPVTAAASRNTPGNNNNMQQAQQLVDAVHPTNTRSPKLSSIEEGSGSGGNTHNHSYDTFLVNDSLSSSNNNNAAISARSARQARLRKISNSLNRQQEITTNTNHKSSNNSNSNSDNGSKNRGVDQIQRGRDEVLNAQKADGNDNNLNNKHSRLAKVRARSRSRSNSIPRSQASDGMSAQSDSKDSHHSGGKGVMKKITKFEDNSVQPSKFGSAKIFGGSSTEAYDSDSHVEEENYEPKTLGITPVQMNPYAKPVNGDMPFYPITQFSELNNSEKESVTSSQGSTDIRKVMPKADRSRGERLRNFRTKRDPSPASTRIRVLNESVDSEVTVQRRNTGYSPMTSPPPKPDYTTQYYTPEKGDTDKIVGLTESYMYATPSDNSVSGHNAKKRSDKLARSKARLNRRNVKDQGDMSMIDTSFASSLDTHPQTPPSNVVNSNHLPYSAGNRDVYRGSENQNEILQHLVVQVHEQQSGIGPYNELLPRTSSPSLRVTSPTSSKTISNLVVNKPTLGSPGFQYTSVSSLVSNPYESPPGSPPSVKRNISPKNKSPLDSKTNISPTFNGKRSVSLLAGDCVPPPSTERKSNVTKERRVETPANKKEKMIQTKLPETHIAPPPPPKGMGVKGYKTQVHFENKNSETSVQQRIAPNKRVSASVSPKHQVDPLPSENCARTKASEISSVALKSAAQKQNLENKQDSNNIYSSSKPPANPSSSESIIQTKASEISSVASKMTARKSNLRNRHTTDISVDESAFTAGSELSSWWQSTYASSQAPEINKVIENALTTERIFEDDDIFADIENTSTVDETTLPSVSIPEDESEESQGEIVGRIDPKNIGEAIKNNFVRQPHLEDDAETLDGQQTFEDPFDGCASEISASVESKPSGLVEKTKSLDSVPKYEEDEKDEEVDEMKPAKPFKSTISSEPLVESEPPAHPPKNLNVEQRHRPIGKLNPNIDAEKPQVVHNRNYSFAEEVEEDSIQYSESPTNTYSTTTKTTTTRTTATKGAVPLFNFSQFGCGVLDVFTNNVCHVPPEERSRLLREKKDQILSWVNKGKDKYSSHSRGDASIISVYTKDDYSMAPSTTSQSTSLNEAVKVVGLSEEERKVWDEWDKKDARYSGESSFEVTGSLRDNNEQFEERQQHAQHSEQRMRAQEKLLLHAYSALSSAPGESPEKPSKVEAKVIPRQTVDTKRKTSKPDRSTPLSSVVKGCALSPVQRQFLEHFCSTLKSKGLEAMKLNRDKKWQPKFFTLSKEVSWINDSIGNLSGDKLHVPQGLLWLKKFSTKSKDQSVDRIDKDGKGGVLFRDMISTAFNADLQGLPELPSKLKTGKFSDSVLISMILLDPNSSATRKIIYHCRNKEEAHLLCNGCNLIIELLKNST